MLAFKIPIEVQCLVVTAVVLHIEPHPKRSKVILKLLGGLFCRFDFSKNDNGVYFDAFKLDMLPITLQKEEIWPKKKHPQ